MSYLHNIFENKKENSIIPSAWVAGNVEGAYKRSVTLGMAIGWGNINGAVTSNIVSFIPPNFNYSTNVYSLSIAPRTHHGTQWDME